MLWRVPSTASVSGLSSEWWDFKPFAFGCETWDICVVIRMQLLCRMTVPATLCRDCGWVLQLILVLSLV